RRKPRICVVDRQAHIPSHVYTYAWKALWQQATSQNPRICVEVHAYAWKSTHMRGKLTQVTFQSH
ncbi:hypothetical protein PIB30_112137, partial [Stylosanthes scabra]|nr:hypothetical protein [Stylosanthes scabra]